MTGVSGSGKSSLVFDTLYAEGQRRYVETFSPYARQFLERMDKPQVDRIEGIPPAIAIDQTNPVRTSRSTVGTMTELADYLKLLYARAASLYCRGCGRRVSRDTPQSIYDALVAAQRGRGRSAPRDHVPGRRARQFSGKRGVGAARAPGLHAHPRAPRRVLDVVADRLRAGSAERARVVEALEAALRVGKGRVNVHALTAGRIAEPGAEGQPETVWRFSTGLHCPDCDIEYPEPSPALFSFNSPLGACPTCRGFGRVIGIDYGLVIPDTAKTLRAGAIKPWQTASFRECQDDLVKYAKKRGIALDVPWRDLDEASRRWVQEGEPEWVNWERSWPGTWYGIKRFFAWLETKAYRMHIRVLLSKYRAYTPCEACGGARLKPDALLWRLGTREDADRVLDPAQRFRPRGIAIDDRHFATLPGLTIHDLVLLPIDRTREFCAHLTLPAPLDEATDLLAHRNPHAPSLPRRRGHRLPDARSPVAHALRR